MAFEELDAHDSTPTIPLTDAQKVRFSEIADALITARTQGYIEANLAAKVLDLVKMVAPLLLGGL